MNRIFFLIFTFLFSAMTIAQDLDYFEIGGNIGLNSSNIYRRNQLFEQRETSNFGFNIAVSATYYFSENWGIKTKIIYDQKGYSFNVLRDTFEEDVFFNDVPNTAKVDIDYVTIPLLLKYHLGETKKWYVHLGPYVGFLISPKEAAISRVVSGFDFGIGRELKLSEDVKFFIEYDGQFGTANFSRLFPDRYNSRSSLNFGIIYRLKN